MVTTRQQMMKRVAIFTDKYPLIGPIVWVLAVQYLIVQLIVAGAWTTVPYSWKNNYISDLGNTACGLYNGAYVCSPLHGLMNLSFIVFGITIAIGALLIYREFHRTNLSLVGFVLMSLAGFGTIFVGLFPENTVGVAHYIGAIFGLVVGNISILILSVALKDVRKSFRIYSALTGLVCLVAFVLFNAEIYLGIGKGGMERIVSYPFAIWMMLFGAYMMATRIKAKMATSEKK